MTITFDAFGKWETSFNYGPCSQRGAGGETPCRFVNDDGIRWDWGGHETSDPYTHVTPDAKNPLSSGVGGFRHWKGSGQDNRQTGTVLVTFPFRIPELWVRWYHRYESGFEWRNGIQAGTKELYFRSGNFDGGSPYIGYGYHGRYRVSNQGAGVDHTNYHGSKGWDDDYPGGVSNGSWVCYEVYMKMDTGTKNGSLRMWRNGELIGQWNNRINWSGNDPRVYDGFERFVFISNQKDPGLERWYYVDLDDLCVYHKTPPNTDANGYPFIGPLDYSGTPQLQVGTTVDPTTGEAPLEVSFTGSVTGGFPPYTYAWDFKDGNTSTDQNPTHTYSVAGHYTPTLTVTDTQQNSNTASTTAIFIQSTEEPAQHFTNFDQYTIGITPYDWTVRDSTGVGWEVKSKYNQTVLTALVDADPSGDRRLITWDEPGQRRHYEVLAVYRTGASDRFASLFSRTVGDPQTGDCYQFRILAGTGQIRRLNSGVETSLATTGDLGLGADTWYAIRFRTETVASNKVWLRGKIWEPANLSDITNDEPSWMIDVEDDGANRLLDNGYTGIGCQRNYEEIDFAFVGIGVGGAIAPAGVVDDWEPPDEPTGEIILSHHGWSNSALYDGSHAIIEDGVLKWHWQQGNTRPDGAGIAARQYLSKPVTELYFDTEIWLSSTWRGSGENWHPHLFHILSNDDGDWSPLAYTHNSLYFEIMSDTSSPYTTYPHFAMQDRQRVNTGHGTPPIDLVGITENRAAGHCNTPASTQGDDISGNGGTKTGDCYIYDPETDHPYYSAIMYKGGTVDIPRDQWVKLRYYVKMNTFTNNVANFDGVVKIWINDTLAFELDEFMFAAGNFHDTKWDKIAYAPFMGNGSPVHQTMWIKELTIYEGTPEEDEQPIPIPDLDIIWDSDDWSVDVFYDGTPGSITTDNELELHWTVGNTRPANHTPARAYFDEPVEEFTMDYQVWLDSNFTDSLTGLFYIGEVHDSKWWNIHVSNCSVYSNFIIDGGDVYHQFTLQDRQRVNTDHGTPPIDLTSITENRAASNCNTPYSDSGLEYGSCIETSVAGVYTSLSFADASIAVQKNIYVHIRMYCKMNTITEGVGNFDGILKIYIGRELAFSSEQILYRAGDFPNTRWDKIAIAPFISGGSTGNQTMWIRNIRIYHGEMIYSIVGDGSILLGGTGGIKIGPTGRIVIG